MRQIHLIYFNFVNADGVFAIGGIETYIRLLALAVHHRYKFDIWFPSSAEFVISEPAFTSHGVHCRDIEELQQILKQRVLKPEDILIYATDQIIPTTGHRHTIGIQHGIYWDLPAGIYRNQSGTRSLRLLKLFDNYRNFRRSELFSTLVCVDYNFLNWKRTLSVKIRDGYHTVILNCAGDDFFSIPEKTPDNENFTLLFPRRFVELRGARVFASVMNDLRTRYPFITIIMAGEGELENDIKKILPPDRKAIYRNIPYHEMPEVMNTADVVVVPSLGSEGSSLAVIEAMAAGRLVVASNVGGINNLIINRFNGLLCNPGEKGLRGTLEMVLQNRPAFADIPRHARETAEKAFTFRRWSDEWLELLHKIPL